jgi:hypothetical protein
MMAKVRLYRSGGYDPKMPAKKKPYQTPKLTEIKPPDSLKEIAIALHVLANATAKIADIQQQRFDKEYPEEPEVHEATVGTAEYRKPGEEGEEEEEDETEPWIGRREKRLQEQTAQRQARRAEKARN